MRDFPFLLKYDHYFVQGGMGVGETIYGYVRVSTQDQNEARQLAAMRKFGVPEENVVVEKLSGKDFNRPRYQRLVRALRREDVLVVKSIDRLGRNYTEILDQWSFITKKREAAIVVLDMPLLDTRQSRDLTGTLISDIVLQLLSYVAQTERENIRQRQAEGIAAAKARGVHFGPEAQAPPENFAALHRAWRARQLTLREAADACGMPKSTFYDAALRAETAAGRV
jgi:DNA invertase Pin-like site-specific DNA recombinase